MMEYLNITLFIIIATCAISIAVMNDPARKERLVFRPYVINRSGEWFRFLSSGFIHGSWLHLIFNMYVLWEFGKVVEVYYEVVFGSWSTVLYLFLYFGGIIVASIPNYFLHRDHPHYGSLGASGAVSGVLFASILFNPWGGISFLFLPGISIPGFVIGGLYLWYSSYMARTAQDHIDHRAHLYGAIFGFLLTGLIQPILFVRFFSELVNGLPF